MVPAFLREIASAPTEWDWTTSSSRSAWNGAYRIRGSFIAESDGMEGADDQGLGFRHFGLDANDPDVMRVGIGSPTHNGQVVSFRFEADIPNIEPRNQSLRGRPSVSMGQQGGWGAHIPSSGIWWDNLPARLGDITSAWTGYKSLTTAGTTCRGQIAHDMRIVYNPQRTYGNREPYSDPQVAMEWAVQIISFRGYSEHPWGKQSEWYRGAVTLDDVTWHLYLQAGAQRLLFQWLPELFPAPKWINLKSMIQYAMGRRFNELPNGAGPAEILGRYGYDEDSPIFNPDHYLISNSIGCDICGPGVLRAEVISATMRVNRD